MSDGGGLPEGWAEARIDAFATTATGGTPSRRNPHYFGGAIPWVKSGELGDGRVYQSEETLTDAGLQESNAKLFPAGTLCIALYGATVGKLGILQVEATTNQAVCGIFLPPEVLRPYLFHFLLSIRSRLVEQGKGGAQPNISNGLVRKTVVPIPPLPEQHRIVEKIVELFSDLDAGVASLERAKANLKRYRASVLKSAVEGMLTEEWRKDHPQAEDGQMLLDRILRERREKWEKDQLQKFKEKGKEPPRNWQSKYEEPSIPDTSELLELPEGWVWATVGQVASDDEYAITDGPFGSNLKTEHYTTSGPLVIRLQNIGDGYFKRDDAHISNERFAGLRRHSVLHNDIVIAMLGEVLPKVCLVPEDVPPAIVKADCVKLTVNPSACVPAFFMHVLNSQPTRRRAALHIAGVGRPRLNLQKLRPLSVPLPPLAEQQQVVALVDERLSQIDAAEKTIDAELLRAKRLRQSILKQAFEGKLVPQDPNDEPASVLLERIKAAREAAQPKKQAKRSKKATSK